VGTCQVIISHNVDESLGTGPQADTDSQRPVIVATTPIARVISTLGAIIKPSYATKHSHRVPEAYPVNLEIPTYDAPLSVYSSSYTNPS
jgi:hypothetical protein